MINILIKSYDYKNVIEQCEKILPRDFKRIEKQPPDYFPVKGVDQILKK